MKAIAPALLVLALALATLSSCKDVPGADGRYAVHDRGLQHGSP
jgi:hypothetical protein